MIEDREGLRSTTLASQLPVARSHDLIVDPSAEDALYDRCDRARRSKSPHARFSRLKESVECEEAYGQPGGEPGPHESAVPSPPIPDGGTAMKAAAVAKPLAPTAGRVRRPFGLVGG